MNTELIQQINQKQRELLNLQVQYDSEVESEKSNVLKSKTKGFTKSLYLLGFEFESSCSRTEQYIEFHRTFVREFKSVLKPYVKEFQISKPNHFDVSGFIKLNNDQIYWFRLEDLRWSKDSILIRTAKDFKDYSGGSNGFVGLDKNFEQNLLEYLGVK